MRKFTSFCKACGLIASLFCSHTVTADGFTGTYFLKAVDFETGEQSAYDNTYLNGVEITITRPTTQANWDLVVTNLCGQGTSYGGTLSRNDSTLTLSNIAYAYFSERDYSGKGTESLGSAEGTMMGSIVIDLNQDGSLSVSDFTVINTILADAPSFKVLATYKDNVATPVKEYYFSSSEEDFSTITSGETPSPHNIVYTRHWGFKVREYKENDNYDVEVSGLGGIPTCKAYGSLAEDGTITLKMLGGAYLSAYEGYSGTGTESLGSPEGTIMGNITLVPQADGTYTLSDFTAINTLITDGALKNTVMATWKNGKATPAQKYHFSATTFTKGEDSPHGVTYPAEFDFTVRRCIENSNYDVVVTGLCGREGVKSYGTGEEKGDITLKMLSGTYLTPYEGYSGIGTECLGSETGAFIGSIAFTAQTDGSFSVSDFTAINMIIDGAPKTTILAKWEGGRGIPVGNTAAVGTATSIAQTQADIRTDVTAKDGSIFFNRETAYRIYATDGTLVRSGKGTRVNGLKAGLYIVSLNGNRAVKIWLR